MNALFKSQLSYCPLVWMFFNRSLKTKINRLHERWVWMVYNNKNSPFNELPEKDSFVSIHHQNVQKPAAV